MKNTVKFCTLMIVLLVTILCLLVLTLLSFSTAQADLQVANKYAETVTQTYELEGRGQQWLAATDKKIKEGKDAKLTTIIGDENDRHLEIKVSVVNGMYEIDKWSFKPKEIHQSGLNNLYKGE